MTIQLRHFFIPILATILSSCGTSIIYSDSYDKISDQTSVVISPYGVIKIPGKWTKTRENDVSGQNFFIGQDSAEIAIALVLWNNYEFSHNNPEVTPDNFVRKYFEWDANYLRKQD